MENGSATHFSRSPDSPTKVGLEPFSSLRSLQAQLESPEELKERLRDVLLQINYPRAEANDDDSPSRSPKFGFENMGDLVETVAKEFQLKAHLFAELSPMFWMFDFDFDNMLRENEVIEMLICMLRRYRDAINYPVQGCVMLGKEIEYANVEGKFIIEKKLCEGAQGAVFHAVGKCAWLRREVIIKMYDKSSPNAPVEDITRDVQLLKSLTHPNVAAIAEIFQDAANVYVVQEPYHGGDLTECIYAAYNDDTGTVCLNEPWLARVARQVVMGVAFLHEKRVVHCNIKDSNVMTAGWHDLNQPQVVVMDFGLSNSFSNMPRPGGTPGFMPPEVWDYGLWTPKGDLFSIGVLLFWMRTGRMPFLEDCYSLEDVEKVTREGDKKMDCGSSELRQLVHNMIQGDSKWRPSPAVILENSWLSGNADAEQLITEDILDQFGCRNPMTEALNEARGELAAKINLHQMKDINRILLEVDEDFDGKILLGDIRKGFEGTKFSGDIVDNLIQSLQGGADKENQRDETVLGYEELCGQLVASGTSEENEILCRIFSEADSAVNGSVPLEAIDGILKQSPVAMVLGHRDPDAIMKEMRPNGAGLVSFEEFRKAVQHRPSSEPTTCGQSASRPRSCGWTIGTKLEYRTALENDWMTCTIDAVDTSTGAVQVDCRPGYWLRGAEKEARLKKSDGEGWFTWTSPRSRGTFNSCSLCVNRG